MENAILISLGILIALVYLQKWAELAYAFVTPQRYLPRIDKLSEGHRAAVAMSTLLRSGSNTREFLENLERNFLSNPEPYLTFGILADLSDAETEGTVQDAVRMKELENGIAALNEKHGNRFFAVIRPRRWNESERCWMGWERKRGKLSDFNRWLLGRASDEAFLAMFGAVEAVRGSRYVLPIDEDNWIENGGAIRLVATLAHPDNAPVFDGNRLVRGYSILSPAIKAFNPLLEPYNNVETCEVFEKTGRVSATLFGQMYCGKGIYEVNAFQRTTEGIFPENRILSHDRLEGLCGNVAFLPDAVFWEEVPATRVLFFRRYERWIRGDLQALVVLGLVYRKFGFLKTWTLLFPVLNALIYPGLCLLWVEMVCGRVDWRTALLLTILGVSTLLSQLPHIAAATLSMLRVVPLKGLRECARCVTDLFWRDILTLSMLPQYGACTAKAILQSSYRLLISRRRLLEWVPAREAA